MGSAMMSRERERELADFLGWFSLGLGSPQITTPGRVNKLIGVRDDSESRFWQRVVGVRELAAAVGILVQRRPREWLWARVAGDLMDLGLLACAFRSKRADAERLVATTASVAGVTVADTLAAVAWTEHPPDDETREDRHMRVRAAITVRAPRDQVYAYWRDFQNLPRFMDHLESVQVTGNGQSHWKASAPSGATVEWNASIVEDEPGEIIAWRSVEDSDIENRGTVRFADAPGDRGTEIHLHIEYDAPGGPLAALIAKLFGEEPTQQAKDDLRRFKQVIETGEVVRSDGTPEGASARRLLHQRPAHPPAAEELEKILAGSTS
jgi:uncharacterized membrane protein